MHTQHNTLLRSRLKNCIETILDLEPALGEFEVGKEFLAEFSKLKNFMQRLNSVFGSSDEFIEENDVKRIEAATANFLEELKVPFASMRLHPGQVGKPNSSSRLQ